MSDDEYTHVCTREDVWGALQRETSKRPAWLALDRMAQAIVDRRWEEHPYDPTEGLSPEQWAEAKEGDFIATRDDVVDALIALESLGWLDLDWDAEPPEVAMVRAEDVIVAAAGAPEGTAEG